MLLFKFSPLSHSRFCATAILAIALAVVLPHTSVGQTTTQENSGIKRLAWIKLKPTGALATFEMPIKPRYVERSFAPIQGKPPVKVRLHLATVNQGKTTYIFGYHDLHEAPKGSRQINAALEGAIRGSVGNVLGQLLDEPAKITLKKKTGRQFSYRFGDEKNRYVALARVYIVGKRQYQISAVSAESLFDENLAGKFLNSLELLEPVFDLPPKPRVTTSR